MSVSTAAGELGVSPRRVRQLLASGQLHGHQLGREWVVEETSVDQLRHRRTVVGRPWHPSSAWAVLTLADGREPAVAPAERTRAARRLATHGLTGLVGRLRARAQHHRYLADPSTFDRLLDEPFVVRAGVSAFRQQDVDLDVGAHAEAYVAEQDLATLVRRYRLDANGDPGNLVLHVVDDDHWPFEGGTNIAPWPVVLVDLMDSTDERTSAAGRRLAERF